MAAVSPRLLNLWTNSVRCLHLSTFLSQVRVLKHPVCTSSDFNPLFGQDSLPLFQSIEARHVVRGVRQLIQQFENDFHQYEESLKSDINTTELNVTWTSVIEPLERLNSNLEYGWGVVSHLNGVKNSEELREAYKEVQPLVVKVSMLVTQSVTLYNTLKILDQRKSSLEEGQERIMTSFLRTARNGGVSLKREEKERFNQITLRLAEIGNQFSNNVLDATKQFSILVSDPLDVAGLPASLLQLTASNAVTQKDGSPDRSPVDPNKGPWKLTLDAPCFGPFMKYSENKDLREKMYKAFITRASSGSTDNSDIIEEIRTLRQEKSALLGFDSHASLSLESKMAGNASEVWKLIHQLRNKSRVAAEKELEALWAFAKDSEFDDELKHWDISYWIEKQRQHLFSFTDEQLRPYFPLPRVLEGLFKLTSELFGVQIVPADGAAEVWHSDVRFFEIKSETDEHLASFYLDPYSRPSEKRGGAWMDSCIGRSEVLNRRPVAYLVCNQTPPGATTPSLMTFREVETLFHESSENRSTIQIGLHHIPIRACAWKSNRCSQFGHGLQHMLTTVRYSDAAGISNVEWDAVELPSQFMENWLYDKTTINMVSGHYQTGQPLPEDLFQQVCKARKYMAGSTMLRQLYLSALDMEFHTSTDSWRAIQQHIAEEYTVLRPLDEDRFPCSFLHIFAGGYAAGYYSYKWAEVMSADAFSAFQEVGLENREALAKVGRRFRDTILASGGSRHPRDVFEDFRNRPPSPEALLVTYGLE